MFSGFDRLLGRKKKKNNEQNQEKASETTAEPSRLSDVTTAPVSFESQNTARSSPPLDILKVTSAALLYDQLSLVEEIPKEFRPLSPDDCKVIDDTKNQAEDGGLSDEAKVSISAIARMHVEDCKRPKWLLVITQASRSQHPVATLTCFMQHEEPNALSHNTSGGRYPNAVIQHIQSESGLITTNVNENLGRGVASNLGLVLGHSFGGVADDLRAKTVPDSVGKTGKVAQKSNLLGKGLSKGLQHSAGPGNSSSQYNEDD